MHHHKRGNSILIFFWQVPTLNALNGRSDIENGLGLGLGGTVKVRLTTRIVGVKRADKRTMDELRVEVGVKDF